VALVAEVHASFEKLAHRECGQHERVLVPVRPPHPDQVRSECDFGSNHRTAAGSVCPDALRVRVVKALA
jgi:hypothetical protein